MLFQTLFILVLSLGWNAWAQKRPAWYQPLTREQCPSFDLSQHFSQQDRDQKYSLCWAYVTAALFEEELCLRSPESCGKTFLSPADVARHSFNFSEGAFGREAVGDVSKTGGICPDDLAQVDQFQPQSFNWKIEKEMMKLDSKYTAMCRADQKAGFDPDSFQKTFRDDIEKIAGMVNAAPGEDPDLSRKLFQALQNRDEPRRMVAEVVIPKGCAQNRIAFPGIEAKVFWDPKRIRENLIEGFQQGRSSSVSVCSTNYEKLLEMRDGKKPSRIGRFLRSLPLVGKKNPYKKDPYSCADHEVVVNGMRWNEEKQACEVHMRNTWGDDGTLSGWESADDVLPFIANGFYLTKKAAI
ncbi:MAG: hypothetical protein JNL01_06145 [Bdellovibrionales bacterium]|nr:hypothetical protein [Bdellovibrionales bacterium]